MKLFHGPYNVGDVFYDVRCPDFAKRTVGEGEWEVVEIGHDIGAGIFVAIETDGARELIDSAADVKNGKLVELAARA